MKFPTMFCVGLLLCVSVDAGTPDARFLVEQLDKSLHPTRSFAARLVVNDILNGRPDGTTEVQLYARKTEGYPDFDTIALCLAPEADRGKVVLTKGTEAWYYDPKAERPVSVSYKKFRDKVFIFYALVSRARGEYDAELLGSETISDATGRERSCHHLLLTLRESYKGTAPDPVHYWIDVENLRPVRGKIYDGRRLLRTVYYAAFTNVLDEMRPMRIPIVNGVKRGLLTDIHVEDLIHRDFSADWFSPGALPRISKGELP